MHYKATVNFITDLFKSENKKSNLTFPKLKL